MAIDQWGREVTVPSAQCARLGAWLAAQEKPPQARSKPIWGAPVSWWSTWSPPTPNAPTTWSRCPASRAAPARQVQVPSRLRDAWDIELRWAPPAMPAWDAVRRLGQLLNSIQIVPGPDLVAVERRGGHHRGRPGAAVAADPERLPARTARATAPRPDRSPTSCRPTRPTPPSTGSSRCGSPRCARSWPRT